MGVNPSANGMWLACAHDGEVVPSSLFRLELPSGMESGQQLMALLDECERALRDLSPDQVVLLDPEPTARITFSQARARVTGETLLALAAAKADLPYERLSRPQLRSRLALPRSGKLPALVKERVPQPLAPHWTGKRDLAALAALAARECSDADG